MKRISFLHVLLKMKVYIRSWWLVELAIDWANVSSSSWPNLAAFVSSLTPVDLEFHLW